MILFLYLVFQKKYPLRKAGRGGLQEKEGFNFGLPPACQKVFSLAMAIV